MAAINRTFVMEEQPREAQERFRTEIGESLRDMGFKLRDDTPGHLGFRVRYLIGGGVWILVTGWITILHWLWRLMCAQRIEADFTSQNDGCKVEVYGRTNRGVASRVALLGRMGHWPTSTDDPDWVLASAAASTDDPYGEWDNLEDVDPGQLDRITRRALKKAGRI